jgi:hypothetical protein
MPRDATLSPSSKVPPKNRGKVPGRFLSRDVTLKDGTVIKAGWVGFGKWTKFRAEPKDLVRWQGWPNASVLMQTRIFHCLDVDVNDALVSKSIEQTILEVVGDAPIKYRENSNRVTLMYRIKEGEIPLRKWRIEFLVNGKKEAVELLASGQQTVVEGIHPSGEAYKWRNRHPCTRGVSGLSEMSHENFDTVCSHIRAYLEMMGFQIISETGGSSDGVSGLGQSGERAARTDENDVQKPPPSTDP